MSEPLVKIEGLTRRFDVSKPWLNRVIEREERQFLTANADVSFEIAKGETFALVGESGSGKSTIAKMVVGLLAPSAGSIRFDGQPIDASAGIPRSLRRRFQMIFQDPFASLNPRWRVGEIISEPIRTFGLMNATDARREAARLLEVVGLSANDVNKFPHEFSGGQRQRLAIARALVTRPKLLVLDEPVSALDMSVRGEVLALLTQLQADYGLTYLIISHDLDMVAAIADRVLVMEAGQIVEQGPPAQLFAEPREVLTRALVAARLPAVG